MSHFTDKGSLVSISTCQTEDAVSAFSILGGGADKMDTQTRLRRRGYRGETEGWENTRPPTDSSTQPQDFANLGKVGWGEPL